MLYFPSYQVSAAWSCASASFDCWTSPSSPLRYAANTATFGGVAKTIGDDVDVSVGEVVVVGASFVTKCRAQQSGLGFPSQASTSVVK